MGASAAGSAAGDFGKSTGVSVTGAAGGNSVGTGLTADSVVAAGRLAAGGKSIGEAGLVVGAAVSMAGVLFSIRFSAGAVSEPIVLVGIVSLDPIPPMPPALDFLLIAAGSLAMLSVTGRYQKVVKAQRTIQSRTEIAVILVKISPAFTPKALAPPAQPKAPVRPPPRPRWSKMISTMKSERRNKTGPKTYWDSIAKGKNTAKIS